MAKGNNIESFREKGWLKLDNAAKLYPAIISKDLTSVFRLTVYMKARIKYSAIREAVVITSQRFPYFSVSLRSGLFWHFLEFNNQLPRIQVEEEIPCTAFAVKRRNEPLYRVLVKGNRISVEFIHILTDGSGAMEYFKSLLYSYLSLTGKQISSDGGIILPDSPVLNEEMEDSYMKYFKKVPPPSGITKAWHLPFKLNKRPRLRVMHVEMAVDQVLIRAHKYNVSITEYFISVYLLSLQEIFLGGRKTSGKALRIEVPVNLRNKLPSRTMRNFTLFVLPEIDLRLGTYTFEEILQSVHHQMQLSSDIKQIGRFLSQNVSYEKLLLIRALPLFVKKISIAAIYRGLASRRFSGMVTNMGLIKLPKEMEEMIDSFELIAPPPNPEVKVGCTMISFNNRLRICFSNLTSSHELERCILKHLTGTGINVKILSCN
ncbi:MAG TPA: hypothetical protein VHO50_08685 [Bacteroidales bacterium]|nr:hypothetical protein [Bacteroidales bacterium]